MGKTNDSVEPSPEFKSNCLSRILFHWAQPLFNRASTLRRENKALEDADLFPLPSIDRGEITAPIFERSWSDQLRDEDRTGRPPSLPRALGVVVGQRFWVAGLIKAFNSCLQFTFPVLLSAILRFIEDTQAGAIATDAPGHVRYRGYWLSALLFAAMALKALLENKYFHAVYRSGYQARVAVSVAVYKKALRLSPSDRNGRTLGELINLMQVDASKIEMFVPQMHVLWDGLLQIAGYMSILYGLIGWPCFAGLVIMILAGPVQGSIMGRLFGLNRKMAGHTDARVKTTNEAVQGIRCVKMYTWEDSFQEMISKSRDEELKFLGTSAYLRGFSRAYMGALPGIVAVVSFVVYAVWFQGGNAVINASTLFAALVAFDQLRFPLLFYPMALAQFAQAQVSSKRVEDFLRLKEIRRDDAAASKTKNNEGSKAADAAAVDSNMVKGVYRRNDDNLKSGEIKAKDLDIYWSDPDVPPVKNDSNDKSDNRVAPENQELSTSIRTGPILRDVDLAISPGELCAVVGRVGSGKTTLCSAMLNETVLCGGSMGLRGTVAYAAQSPWILNATLRDNVTFGRPFERERYEEVIKSCQLTHDLALLDFGDMTEIGENGINLSGGQKQRVSIARAAYSGADIVILDDPLSALDPEVGKKLFDASIVRFMKGKTRILVTNQLQCLQYCDSIIALGQGRVIEEGTFDKLSKSEGEVQRLLDELKVTKAEVQEAQNTSGRVRSNSNASGRGRSDSVVSTRGRADSVVSEGDKNPLKKENQGLVSEEERSVGAVSWKVYRKYFEAGGGLLQLTFAIFMFVLCALNSLLSVLWISYWTTDPNHERHPRSFYLSMYAAMAVSLGFFTFFRSYILAKFGVRASGVLHKNLLASVLNAPMSFFDTTPTGRILSRFSKDLYSIDLEISDNLDFFILCVLTVVVSLSAITFVTPYFAIALVPIFVLYIKVLNYFRDVSRETKRLDSISRSPVFAHFSETLGGLGTIRAYGQTDRFIEEFDNKVDHNTRTYYNNKIADRWLSVRLELLGATIGGLAAFFASVTVIDGAASGSPGTNNFASYAGVSLNFAISVTGLLNWLVRSFAQTEATMNSAERILYYTENIPQEAPSNGKDLKVLAEKSSQIDSDGTPIPPSVVAAKANGIENPSPDWPSKGDVTFSNLKMRYRPENPLVIKGLNVEIKAGERVGVVGRTGSGKSSLLLTLLRIVEPDLKGDEIYESPITIDGVDILRIGLKELRSKIGIIPQNPVLFSGTIRSNMDPFDQFTDEQIWSAIERCGMKEAILETMPEHLNAPIAEYGENLSQGQRQLLCLGRALLKKCRILLLDEATSSVDYETDSNIQRTIRKDFDGCTVLTVAHRVNTIMDSDKILVMKDGKVGEFASPDELLANPKSFFSDIVKHSHTEEP